MTVGPAVEAGHVQAYESSHGRLVLEPVEQPVQFLLAGQMTIEIVPAPVGDAEAAGRNDH